MTEQEWATPNETPDPPSERMPRVSGWRILIRPVATPEKTAGGIWKPDSYKDREDFGQILGRVVQVGSMAYTRDDMGTTPWCKEGDYVLYGKYDGKHVEVDNVKFVILNDDNILAVVPEPKAVMTF